MKNSLWIGAAGLLIGATLGYSYVHYENARLGAAAGTSTSLRLGAVLPLTGDYASLGEEVRRGVELGVNEANKNGLQIQATFEDAKSDFGTGPVSAANKLLNANGIDLGLTMIVEEAKPIIPLFTAHKVPLLVVWDSNKFLEQSGDYVFSTGFSTEKAGEAMAAYAFNALHVKRIAVIRHQDAWADVITPAFIQKYESLGGIVIYDETVSIDTTDYRTVISKIKASNADGVYFPLVPPTNAQFVIQAKQYGLKGPLMTGDAFIQDVVSQVGGAAEGIYYTNTYTDTKEALTALYTKKYGSAPKDVTLVSMGYDGVMHAAQAMHNNSSSLHQALLELFGPNRALERVEKIVVIHNGQPVPVSQQ